MWSKSLSLDVKPALLAIRAWCDGGFAQGRAAIGWSIEFSVSRDIHGDLIWRKGAECGCGVNASGSLEAELIACREVVLATLAFKSRGSVPFTNNGLVDVSVLRKL